MKHASLTRFKLSRFWMVLGCLFLAAAQTGADQAAPFVGERRPL